MGYIFCAIGGAVVGIFLAGLFNTSHCDDCRARMIAQRKEQGK